MAQFRDDWYDFAPPWLRTGNAERYMYTLELMRDLLCEKANQAQKIRMPGQGDPSQIPYLAHDRQLLQGPNETNASFIQRLKGAFQTWAKAGSALAVLEQLQAYAQGFQPGVPSNYPEFRIVSNPRSVTLPSAFTAEINTWWTTLHDGGPPFLLTVAKDFDWDGNDAATWRCWLIVYQTPVDTGQSGTGASIDNPFDGSFTDPGHNVSGVWVPRSFGTLVNQPFLEVTGLAGLTSDNLGDFLTLSGGSAPSNDGTWQIVQVITPSDCIIANKDGVAHDFGPFTSSISHYEWMAPALAMGSPGQFWGDGESVAPPKDTGDNVRGLWRPSTIAGIGSRPTYAWGVRVDPLDIETIRGLVKQWKSAGTYYPNLIICYDGHDGVDPNSCYTPFTNNNPTGTFGSGGVDEDGVWIPTRQLESPLNAFCQGTGIAQACGVENIS